MDTTTPQPVDLPHTPRKLKNTVEKIIASDTPLQYIEKSGIDLEKIYKELGNIALNATVAAKDKYGDAVELGPDNRARLGAIGMILELAKHLKDKNTVTQVGIFNDPKIVEEANRVLALKNRV